MERAALAAGVYGPSKNEGREKFIQVKPEVLREPEIIHIFFDMELFRD